MLTWTSVLYPSFEEKDHMFYETSFVILVSGQGHSSSKNLLNAEVQQLVIVTFLNGMMPSAQEHKAESLSTP